jgi:transcriptional regulator with XRE-family HTH domain
MDDLFREVQAGLAARKEQWQEIADGAGVSRSWIYQVASGLYRSAPSYKRLNAVRTYLLTGKPREKTEA